MFGKDILFAFVVGCTFSITLARSAISDVVREANFMCCTGSFHGAAHSRSCQLDHIITSKEGAGIYEGEGCERVFSSSNGIVVVTRHASSYYRHLRIHIYFTKWDEEKYERLGDILHLSQYLVLILVVRRLLIGESHICMGTYTRVHGYSRCNKTSAPVVRSQPGLSAILTTREGISCVTEV